jgi:hypothetical protein
MEALLFIKGWTDNFIAIPIFSIARILSPYLGQSSRIPNIHNTIIIENKDIQPRATEANIT